MLVTPRVQEFLMAPEGTLILLVKDECVTCVFFLNIRRLWLKNGTEN